MKSLSGLLLLSIACGLLVLQQCTGVESRPERGDDSMNFDSASNSTNVSPIDPASIAGSVEQGLNLATLPQRVFSYVVGMYRRMVFYLLNYIARIAGLPLQGWRERRDSGNNDTGEIAQLLSNLRSSNLLDPSIINATSILSAIPQLSNPESYMVAFRKILDPILAGGLNSGLSMGMSALSPFLPSIWHFLSTVVLPLMNSTLQRMADTGALPSSSVAFIRNIDTLYKMIRMFDGAGPVAA